MSENNEVIENYIVENAALTPYEEMEYHIVLAMTREMAIQVSDALSYSRHLNPLFHGLENSLRTMVGKSKEYDREQRYNYLMECKRSELANMVLDLEDERIRP